MTWINREWVIGPFKSLETMREVWQTLKGAGEPLKREDDVTFWNIRFFKQIGWATTSAVDNITPEAFLAIAKRETTMKQPRYVTDLLSVRPEEIQHVDGDEVLGIFHNELCIGSNEEVTVVMRWGGRGICVTHYCRNGKLTRTDEEGSFIYKPHKRRVLKPLHQILAENPGYKLDSYGVVIFAGDNTVHQNPPIFIVSNHYLYKLEGGVEVEEKYDWPESFIMEVDCE